MLEKFQSKLYFLVTATYWSWDFHSIGKELTVWAGCLKDQRLQGKIRSKN